METRLIVVQRNELAGRALARCLASLFVETRVTTCPREAETLLFAEGAPPTALVCGQRFADDDPPGVDWVARWRCSASSLRRAVLVTAEPPTERPSGLDAIFDKPVVPASLRSFFAEGDDPVTYRPHRLGRRAGHELTR